MAQQYNSNYTGREIDEAIGVVRTEGGIPKNKLASDVQTSLGLADSAYQKPSAGIPSSDMTEAVQTSLGKANSAYQKHADGIPSTDMTEAVQTSLGKADTALQTHQDISGKANDSVVVHNTGNETIAGVKTFSSTPVCATAPTSSSELANKSYVDNRHDVTKQDVISDLTDIRSGAAAGATAYQMPEGGIPESNLATSVQNKLNAINIGTFTIEGGNAPKSFIKAIIVGRTLSVGAEFIGASDNPTCHHTAVILVCEGNVIRFLYSNDNDKKIQSCAYVPDSDESFNSYSPVSATAISGWNAKYDKPSSGIPSTHLASAVQTSLGKANSALQPASIKTIASGDVTGNTLIGIGDFRFKTVKNQTLIGEGNIDVPTVVDNLTSTSTTAALSANQGRVLKGLVDAKATDTDVVHKTGDETISGNKKFNSLVEFLNPTYFSTNYGAYFKALDNSTLQEKLDVTGTALRLRHPIVSGGSSGFQRAKLGDVDTPELDTDAANKSYVDTSVAGKYTKPATGIPLTDLASIVQTSLGKADTALQSAALTPYRTSAAQDIIDATKYERPSAGIPSSDMTEAVRTSLGKADTAIQEHQSLTAYRTSAAQDTIDATKYVKPADGIPSTDLASAVQTSLGKADTALQTHQSIKTLTSGTTTEQSLIGPGDLKFKTVNGQSLIGEGDISGGSSVTVVDNLESTSTTSALSANQGRVLKGLVDAKYTKDASGIPSTDMTTAVQTSLGKADSALQSGSLKTINQTSLVGSGDISIPVVQVIDSTSSSSTTAALSANQGRQLNAALSNKQATISDLTTIRSGAAAGATAYQKPASGIPSTDLESAVQTKLTNAVLTTGAQTISGAKTFSAVPSCTVAPTTANHITNKTYVDGVVATKATDTAVVHKAEAETVTGLKSFEGGFTAYDATFIDEAIFTDSTSGGHSVEVKHVYDEQGDANVLEFDGDVSTSVRLKKILAPIDGTDAANKSYVDGHHDSTKADESAAVHKTGDETISGKKTFSAYGNEFTGIIAHDFTLSDTNEESDVYFHTNCDDDNDQVLWFDGNQGSVYLGGFSAPKTSDQLSNKGYVDSVAATKAPAVTLGSSYPAGGFVPNVYYNMGTISSDVTWNLATATNIFDEYMIEFSVGSTVPVITWGTGFTKWIGGSAPTLLANKTYQISVQNGLAVSGEF